MRNICHKTQTLDRQSFVLGKPKSLASILSSFHSIIKAKHSAEQPYNFPKTWVVWVPKQYNVCVSFHLFSRCMAWSSRVHNMSTARKTQRTLLVLISPQEKRQRNKTGRYMSFVFSLIILKHHFLQNYIWVIHQFICCLKSIKRLTQDCSLVTEPVVHSKRESLVHSYWQEENNNNNKSNHVLSLNKNAKI